MKIVDDSLHAHVLKSIKFIALSYRTYRYKALPQKKRLVCMGLLKINKIPIIILIKDVKKTKKNVIVHESLLLLPRKI